MISGVEGRGLESWGHLSLQGQRRLIVMRPTFPTHSHNPPGFTLAPTPPPPPPPPVFLSSCSIWFSSHRLFTTPTVLCLHLALFLAITLHFVFLLLSCSELYYNLLLSVAFGQNVWLILLLCESVCFCDKQRFMSCLFILF